MDDRTTTMIAIQEDCLHCEGLPLFLGTCNNCYGFGFTLVPFLKGVVLNEVSELQRTRECLFDFGVSLGGGLEDGCYASEAPGNGLNANRVYEDAESLSRNLA